MLDIRFIASSSSLVKQSLEKRGQQEKFSLLDEACSLWSTLKAEQQHLEQQRHRRNQLTQQVNQLRKEGKTPDKLIAEAREVAATVTAQDKAVAEKQQRLDAVLAQLPNIVHESVPVGKDETENKEIKKWGSPVAPSFPLQDHGSLLEKRGLVDFRRAAKIAGAGFYFLKDDLVLLEQALIRFAQDFLRKNGFTLVSPPLMMRKQPYTAVTDLAAFENVMYKIEGEDEYLIATAEHPLTAMYGDEVLESLPLRLAGISSCFRKEIGSRGVDTKALFRVHQFTKVEMVVLCKPEESWQLHEELLGSAEALFQQLGLPYRVMSLCTGDLGAVVAKTYDIEAWFPRQQKYQEVVSCSNCTDYQSRALHIRSAGDDGEKSYVHTLNSTAFALSRVLACLVENYQQQDGSIAVPDVLQPYLGKKVI